MDQDLTSMVREKCDRCHRQTSGTTIMSWFTTEVICMACHAKERELRLKLNARESLALEGCGYLPRLCPECDKFMRLSKDTKKNELWAVCDHCGVFTVNPLKEEAQH